MRCFIAIDIDKKITEEIVRVQKEILKKKIFLGKITEKENLHLTLKFLGEIEDEKMSEVRNALRTIEFNSFNSWISNLGVFHHRKSPKIIWMKIKGKELMNLHKIIDEKIEGLGFVKEKIFMSHLTVARIKKPYFDKRKFIEELHKIKNKKLKFEVNRFSLLKSELTPQGPIYEVLEDFYCKKE